MKYLIVIFLCIARLSLLGHLPSPIYSIEANTGKIIPIYPNFPKINLRGDLALSVGFSSDSSSWGKYYNYPTVGTTLRASYLGDESIFGYQFSLYPYLNFRLNSKKKPLYIRTGIGLAAFTTQYDPIENPNNQLNGSTFSWCFNISFYQTLVELKNYELRLTAGFFHASNGHLQIPNYGVNAGLIGFEIATKQVNKSRDPLEVRHLKPYWVLELNSGLGLHELAATTQPVGTPKFGIGQINANLGYVWREHLKIKAGVAGRYYNSYFSSLTDSLRDPSFMDASSVSIMLGAEFLFGHIGLDIEEGINVYKPFFKEFYDRYEGRSHSDYVLKSLISSRLGVNYYLFKCNTTRKLNVKLGAHINANYTQADFADMSLGLTYRL